MNMSNRFNMETAARQRQAEIEQHLRRSAQLRDPQPAHPRRNVRLVTIGATLLSALGTVAFIVIGHVR